jgi:hypothetical protein
MVASIDVFLSLSSIDEQLFGGMKRDEVVV